MEITVSIMGKVIVAVLASVIAFTAGSAFALELKCSPLNPDTLKDLKHRLQVQPKGFLILFRHDKKDPQSGKLTKEPNGGVEHAKKLAKALLSVPLSNEVYYATKKHRVRRTAGLAFGGDRVNYTNFGGSSERPADIVSWAQSKLGKEKKPTNLIVFVDSNIINNFDSDYPFACGEDIIVEPSQNGSHQCKARLFPEKWKVPPADIPWWAREDDDGSRCKGKALAVREE